MMEWKDIYLDATLVPLGVAILLAYHAFLLWKVRSNPLQTVIGVNHLARRLWVYSIVKDNDKKNILAVQTLRNNLMGSTLMASTSILMSSAIGAFMSSTYFNTKNPILGGGNQNIATFKYLSLIFCFFFSFLCYMQSVRYINHVNFLVNIPIGDAATAANISPDYVAKVLAKGCNFFTVGTRGFYVAFPLLLWLFGPVPVVICAIVLVPVLYYLDRAEYVGEPDSPRSDTKRKWNPDLESVVTDLRGKNDQWNTVELRIRASQEQQR